LDIAWGRLIGFFAAIGFVVVATVAGFFTWAIYHPDKAWRWIHPLVMSRDIQVSWTGAQFKTQKKSLKNWRLDWSINGLKVVRAKPKLQMQMDVRFAADLSLIQPRTGIHIENLEVSATAPWIHEPTAAPEVSLNPHEKSESIRRSLQRLNDFVSVAKMKISIPDFTVGAGTQAVKVTVEGGKPGAKDPKATEFLLGFKNASFQSANRFTLRPDQLEHGGAILRAEVNASGPALSAQASFDVALPEAQLVSNFKIKGTKGKSTFSADGHASILVNQIALKGKSDFDNLPGGVASAVKGAEWAMEIPLWPGVVLSSLAGRLNITAPISMDFISPAVRAQLERSCQCKWPTTLKAVLDGKIWASHIFDNAPELRPVATLAFKFDALNNPLINLNLTGELRVTHNKDQTFQVSPAVDASIKLPNFQAVKTLLEANKIMVPSPFDILNGSIEATIKTTLWQSDKGLVIPIDAKANLASSDQKVVLDSKINLYIPADFKSMDIMLDFNLHDFVVELPPVDPVRGIPQLTKDSRLQMKPEEAVPDGAFKFRLMYGVRTSKPGAVRLLSKLAKPAIPISLDLDRTAKGDTLGTIKIEPFELSYMHRSMNIDLLRMILDDRETADFAIDGHLRMDQSQAKIKIAVSGSLRSPLIKLSSEPEMSRSDIISLMLYDRTSDQLVSADRETVGSFDAAIADRAIGLLGLWVFASTPIRSFSYNPLTKVYTATVQLAEGTTASIGTDWEEAAQVEVRKRVTRRWVLTASWAPSDSKEQLGKLVLQWEKRF